MKVVIEKTPLPSLIAIVNAMDVEIRGYDWYVSEVEGWPWPTRINNQWLTGKELDALSSEAEPSFSWGVFNAVAIGARPELTAAPYADGNEAIWTSATYAPQIPGAKFEVVFWDSSAVVVTGLTDSQSKALREAFAQ